MPAKTLIRASTQEHLPIKKIQDSLVFLKNGICCLVLKTTAINFGLLSEKEQEATIYAYTDFLNSLAFPIQIIIRSRQKDITSYISLIDQEIKKQKNKKLSGQLIKYRQFIEKTIKKNKILDKKFYIVIPFLSGQLKKISHKRLLEKAKINLSPKRDHLIGQFKRLGLKVVQLTNQNLIKLFYHIYNPQSLGQKFVSARDYSVPFVQSKTGLQSQPKPTPQAQPLQSPPLQAQPSQASVQSPPVLQPQSIQPPPQPPEIKPSLTKPPLSPAQPQPRPIKPRPTHKTRPIHNSMIFKKEKGLNKPLEGKMLQEKMNNIFKKVSNQQGQKNQQG